MKITALKAGVVLLALLLCTSTSVQASDHFEDDLQLWIPVTLELPVTEKISTSLQVETRLRDNIRDMHQLIVLPILSYKLNDHVYLQGGYGWYPSFHPHFRNEQRLLQQILLRKDFSRLKVSLRGRIEERFIEDAGGTSLRNRYLLRLEAPIRKGPFYAVAYDEILINLNTVDHGPRAGLDQNRIFAGLGRKFGNQASAEAGYHLQTVNIRSGAPDQMNHAVMLRLNYRLR